MAPDCNIFLKPRDGSIDILQVLRYGSFSSNGFTEEPIKIAVRKCKSKSLAAWKHMSSQNEGKSTSRRENNI